MPNDWLIDRIRTAAAGNCALLPVHARFGVRAVAARPGHTEFGQRMGPWLLDRHGRLCPGAFLAAADAALGTAVATALPRHLTVMSLTIRAQFVRLQPGDATNFQVHADATHIGEGSGFAAGEIVDDTGRLIARIATHCGYLPSPGPPAATPWAECGFDDSLGEVGTVDDGSDDGLAPLAKARAGARMIGTTEGDVRVGATSTPEIRNSRGDVQGGVLGLLAEQAITACLIRSAPALVRADTMELDVTYLRPLRPDRPDIEIVAQAVHAGGRFALARANGTDRSGRLVVSASGSSYVA